jgi:hypothetical protein
VSTALAPSTDALSAADRCDRCGAQAYVRASLVSGGVLLFCAHHATEHRPALEAAGAVFYDESDRLETTAASAPLDER